MAPTSKPPSNLTACRAPGMVGSRRTSWIPTFHGCVGRWLMISRMALWSLSGSGSAIGLYKDRLLIVASAWHVFRIWVVAGTITARRGSDVGQSG